jgi:hypothetical protein
MPATTGGILENVTVVVSLDIHQDAITPVKKPRIEVYWSFFRLRLRKFSGPDYRRERFLRCDGLLFEVDGDDTGFDGIFEEQ